MKKDLIVFLSAAAMILGMSFSSTYANQAPAIDAGQNDTVPIDWNYSFDPTIEDDSTDVGDLKVRWRQVRGPAQAEIGDSTAAYSSLIFKIPGTYVFHLIVTDAKGLTSSDSVTFVAREQVPFKVLAPINNQPIARGKPFTIKWQTEGRLAVRVFVTYDGGLTETMLSTGASYDSLVRTFDRAAGTQGSIVLRYYPPTRWPDAEVSGSFVIVDSIPQSASPPREMQHSSSRSALLRSFLIDGKLMGGMGSGKAYNLRGAQIRESGSRLLPKGIIITEQ